jgi:serine O-acetyltransferase
MNGESIGTTATAEKAQSCPILEQILANHRKEVDAVSGDVGTSNSLDDMSRQLRQEAIEAAQEEPHLRMLLYNTVLAPGVQTFEDAVATTITYRLLLRPCTQPPLPSTTSTTTTTEGSSLPPPAFCPYTLRGIIAQALQQSPPVSSKQPPPPDDSVFTEGGHTLSEAIRRDAQVVLERDPAVDTLLEVVLFLKGFAGLVCHRVAHYQWHMKKRQHRKKSMVALWLQSQASAVFGMDIHPAATLGAGLLFDHGTGLVIGETAVVGDGCTFLHGVTLGGTGKDSGDRHPKVGRDVLIGANASLLGNIVIGECAKIGAGSIVLRPIPAHATAVGAPAKIVGHAKEAQPGTTMDETLQNVTQFHKSSSISTLATMASSNSGGTPTDTAHKDGDNDDDAAKNEGTQDFGSTSSDEDNDFTASEQKEDEEEEEEGTETPKTKTSPVKKHSQKDRSCDADIMCPYRQYTRLAALAPHGTITLRTLRQYLEPEGCGTSEIIGGILFSLDKRDVGYLKPKDLLTPEAQDLLVEKTGLSPERVATLVDNMITSTKSRRTQSLNSGTSSVQATIMSKEAFGQLVK